MKLPEIVSVGIYNSKYAVKNTPVSKDRKTAMFEIELPVENGGISYINGTSRRITNDMLICAKPGQTRHTKFPYSCIYIHLTIEDKELFNTLSACPDFVEICKLEYFLELFKKLLIYYETESANSKIMLNSVLLELIYEISKSAIKTVNINTTNSSSAVLKAIEYIKTNLSSDLSLESISKHVNLSPIHFHNTFKVAVGKTLHEYVEEERLKESVNLLLTTNMTLAEIAYACGFSSQSYFSFVFRRKMKTTPRNYLKILNEQYKI